MNTKIERFFRFILKDKTKDIFAFIFWIIFIIEMLGIQLPNIIEFIFLIVASFIGVIGCSVYFTEFLDKKSEENKRNRKFHNIKFVAKEIIMFIPIWYVTVLITSFSKGLPENELRIDELFKESPVYYSILIIVIGPILEEFFFRLLPYRFIKNTTMYIIFSSVIFATMHVLNDPNPLYYIWFYMMRPFYYAFRFHKTQKLSVAISLHSFNNLMAILPTILEYF